MRHFKTISRDLVQSLDLRYEPVGVTLYRETDALPAGIPLTGENLKSYCQALVLAGEGRTLLLTREQMGCKLGTSVLGFEKEMEGYLDDGVLEKYGVGLFGSEEASAATIRGAAYLDAGQTRAALIAPLSAFKDLPQVVVFTADSEQVMWLLYAVNYDRGGRMDLPQSGGGLGRLLRHHCAAPAHRAPQRHLSRPGLPSEVGHRRLPPHAGHPGAHPRADTHPHPGPGQAHRHAQEGPTGFPAWKVSQSVMHWPGMGVPQKGRSGFQTRPWYLAI